MAYFVNFIFTITFIICKVLSQETKEFLYWDMFSGRHFNDMVTSSKDGGYSDIVSKPSILIFYKQSCETEMKRLIRNIKKNMPSENYVHVGKVDAETMNEQTWYSFDEKDDLQKRYLSQVPKDECLVIIYLEEGQKLNQFQVVPQGMDLDSYIWHKLIHPVSIKNEMKDTFYVKVSIFSGKPTHITSVLPGKSDTVYPYVGNTIAVYDSKHNFLYGYQINYKRDTKKIVVNEKIITEFKDHNLMRLVSSQNHVSFYKWTAQQTSLSKNELMTKKQFMTAVSRLYMSCAIYARNLPKLTTIGYEVLEANKDIVNPIAAFSKNAHTNKDVKREHEPREPVANTRDTRVLSYHFTDDLVQKLESTLKPRVEKFAETPLILKESVVIAYYPGSIIRDHVEMRDGHVITALIAIGDIEADESKNDMSWNAEIVTLEGKRKVVSLKPGKMMIYESKSIIISRRNVIKSDKPYYVAVISYQPATGWPWQFAKDKDGNRLYDDKGLPITRNKEQEEAEAEIEEEFDENIDFLAPKEEL